MNAIAAVDQNWGIGSNGGLLVHLSGDLKYFKERTYGKTILVGRKTLESFPGKKALPGRRNIVLTQTEGYQTENCEICGSREEALSLLDADSADVFVCGGEAIYRNFFDDCDTFFITKIYQSFPADRWFPKLDGRSEFVITWQSELQEEQGIRYQFFQYMRK